MTLENWESWLLEYKIEPNRHHNGASQAKGIRPSRYRLYSVELFASGEAGSTGNSVTFETLVLDLLATIAIDAHDWL